MTEPSPSSQTPLLGRGVPFRFEEAADLGPIPEQGPIPRETVSSVPSPSERADRVSKRMTWLNIWLQNT